MSDIKRIFYPGDEWLYYKIYCGPKISDRIISESIQPLVNMLYDKKLIDSWFFIRYKDSDLHLRLRFHLTDTKHTGSIIEYLNNSLRYYCSNEIVWKLQLDTYRREVERYGSETITLSEALFCYDSEMCADIISVLEGDEDEEIRWLSALTSIDRLLNDFSFDLQQKHDLLEILNNSFMQEFKADKRLKKEIGGKFRANRDKIIDVMSNGIDRIDSFLELRSTKNKSCISSIVKITDESRTQTLISSYIHMTVNRLFRTRQRKHELVLYNFLFRYYKYKINIEKG